MGISKTPNLQLNVFPQTEEGTILVRDLLRSLAEDNESSNMYMIDQAIHELQLSVQHNEVWSQTEPIEQNAGDIWNEILRVE